MQIPRAKSTSSIQAERTASAKVLGQWVQLTEEEVDWRLGGQRSTHSSSNKGYCAYYLLGMQVQTGPCGKGTQCDWEDIPKGADG